MPARWLIGPGLLLVGVGLIIMGGLTGGSRWTHLIPGFIVSGLGGGLVNPPLASTAIGVVPPQKAGMASGVNSTFRQIGIAAGIAALGSIFNSALQHNLASNPAVGSSAPRVVSHGPAGPGRPAARQLARRRAAGRSPKPSGPASPPGLNDLLIVTGVLAFAGAVCALLLIRKTGLRAYRSRGTPGGVRRPGRSGGRGQFQPGSFGVGLSALAGPRPRARWRARPGS